MELATSLYNRLSEVLGNLHVVKEVPSSEYVQQKAIDQDGKLKLYKDQYIDCILYHPTQSTMVIRLFRMPKTHMASAKMAFRSLAIHLPNFYSNFPSWYTANRLTKLSELIRQNESWSSTHIAIQAGLIEVLTKEKMESMINSQNCDKKRSPMHLACDLHRLDMLEKCVMIGGDLGLQDEKGDTVVHYCVSKCAKTFMRYICGKASIEILNIQNNEGETALHSACKQDKLEYFRMLREAGASIKINSFIGSPLHYALKNGNHDLAKELLKIDRSLVDMHCNKYRGLPMHWCRTGEDVSLLFSHASDLAHKSVTGDMPLHVMIKKNRLDAAIGMILSHADINGKGKNGNTPLHLAIQNDNEALVKMLLLYGANCKAQNDFEETPGLLSIRNSKPKKEAIINLMSSIGGIALGDEVNGKKIVTKEFVDPTPGTSMNGASQKAKILCLDGGGIRGLVLTQTLIAIEDQTGKQIRDLFDWICGTSTGGILALALTLGIKAVDCQSIYFRLKDKVFAGGRPYDSGPMEEFLKSIFGEDTTMGDIKGECKVILTSVLADQRPAKLHLFRNYEPAHECFPAKSRRQRGLKKVASVSVQDILADPMDTPLWQVARSSGAAPTYFRPMGSFVDGGVMANNPTLDVLTEIHMHNRALKRANRKEDVREPGLVVSVGTGKIPVTKVKSVDVLRPTNPINLVNSALAGIELTQVMIEATCECDGHVQKRAEAWCESTDIPYYRINPQLKEETMMDETRDEKLVDMMWTTKLYLHKNKHLIEEIIHLLDDKIEN